jgi:hypothetical protein
MGGYAMRNIERDTHPRNPFSFANLARAMIQVYVVGGTPLLVVFALTTIAFATLSGGNSEVAPQVIETITTALITLTVVTTGLLPILGFMRWKADMESKERVTIAIFEEVSNKVESQGYGTKLAKEYTENLTSIYLQVAETVANYDPKTYADANKGRKSGTGCCQAEDEEL